jgi:hypothetical protein
MTAYSESDLGVLERSGGALVGVSDRRDELGNTMEYGHFADTGMLTTFKLRGLALTYDSLRPGLDGGTRRLLTETLAREANRLYQLAQIGKALLVKHKLNHTWVDVASFGLVALALYDEHPDAATWLNFARDQYVERLIPETIGGDGDFPEPGGYVWEYALTNALIFLEGLRRRTGEDALRASALSRVPAFLVGVSNPIRGVAFDEDMTGFDRGEGVPQSLRPFMLRMASLLRNPTAQWFAIQSSLGELAEDNGKLYPGGHWFPEEREYTGHYELLWYDETLPSQPPLTRPFSRLFRDTGLAVLRTGYDLDDSYLAFRSGPFLGPHDRLDQNKFVLYAQGERWIEHLYGPNYGSFEYFKNTPGSNTLLVDGLGQDAPEAGMRHSTFEREYKGSSSRGQIVACGESELGSFVVGEATRAYGARLQRFTRSCVLLSNGIALVLDDVAGRADLDVTSLLHTTGRVESCGVALDVWKGTQRLRIQTLLPREARWNVCRTPLDNYGRTLPRHLELRLRRRGTVLLLMAFTVLQRDEEPRAIEVTQEKGAVLVTVRGRERESPVTVRLRDHQVEISSRPARRGPNWHTEESGAAGCEKTGGDK